MHKFATLNKNKQTINIYRTSNSLSSPASQQKKQFLEKFPASLTWIKDYIAGPTYANE